MKNTSILFILLIVISSLFVACSNTASPTTTQSPPLESTTYTNSEYGFSCYYPKDWDTEEDLDGILVMFVGPRVGEHGYPVNINLTVREIPSSLTVEDFARVIEGQIKKASPDYVKLQEQTTTINEIPAIMITFISTIQDLPQKMKDIQAFFKKGEVIYAITYDVPIDYHDEYADYYKLVINSFKFE